MKKMISILVVLGFVWMLVACGDNGNEQGAPPVEGTEVVATGDESEDGAAIQIEGLGETIVAAGMIWEDWWHGNGRFASEHVDYEEMIGGMYSHLLPTSGFENLDDIRNYLLQYYTENWVESTMSDEGFAFVEYFDILYMHTIRAGFPRPDWSTATHTLIEQDGDRIVVETIVLAGAWQPDLVYPSESVFRFTFIDGRIDEVSRNMIHYMPDEG